MIKYQIFVSSTYEDLKDERAQVIKAVLEMGHIPVGMEMFSAADEEQWKIIARQIDETDYYVVVVGNRYGSVTGGVSYTEKEFDYAVSKGIPVLGFVIDSSVESLAKNVDTSEEKIAALAKFKAKVKQRPVGFWKSCDELHGKVSIALMKAFNTSPRTGWTRATGVAGPEVMQELSRLSKENADLREQLALGTQQEAADRRAHLQSLIETLKSVPRTIFLREKGKTEWEIKVEKSLFDIFEQLAPEMMVETSVSSAGMYLSVLNRPRKDLEFTKQAPIPINHISELFADLASLGLVEPSKKKHQVSDKEFYWSLTEEGLDVLKLHRATRLEATASKVLAGSEMTGKPTKRASKPKVN